ncbi:ATP-binding protein [Nocardioides iriomotensis]|uniref:ATP-binding protein n=1 Tax=Nocardioides iriomotensis TaxID=715784 RepID=A0A4Q5JC79_9ACTN|nr:ATP-binding protein [Nocardioides iriomotensis]RYU15611.1 ATP-binding protein [Nocardioides iriomotensis]
MSTTASASTDPSGFPPPSPPPSAVPGDERLTRPTRRARRSRDDRILAGVAGGLAQHLGLDPMHVRIAFVLACALGGLGLVFYAGLWMILPADPHLDESAPGLEAATRQGKRQGRASRLSDAGPLVAIGVFGLGIVILAQGMFGGSLLFWPVLLGVVGLGVLWWQADEAQRERWIDSTGRIDLWRAVVGSGGAAAWVRLAVGVALLVSALVLFAVQTGQMGVARDVVLAGVLGVVGLALMVGPWLFRLSGDLSEERSARVRSQERADMAAHLHDSVLQTLALIQKHADDGRTVAKLARAQERDLRSWLYGEDAHPETSVAAALRAAAAEVEDAFGVPVEVVTVGDVAVDEARRPLVLAAREAMVNAAKHSGADKVDVFAECDESRLEVFVRDRGQGFDPDAVPQDRMGVRNSIQDRMARHGGTAVLRTAPGEGTEVRLAMTRKPTAPPEQKQEEDAR